MTGSIAARLPSAAFFFGSASLSEDSNMPPKKKAAGGGKKVKSAKKTKAPEYITDDAECLAFGLRSQDIVRTPLGLTAKVLGVKYDVRAAAAGAIADQCEAPVVVLLNASTSPVLPFDSRVLDIQPDRTQQRQQGGSGLSTATG